MARRDALATPVLPYQNLLLLALAFATGCQSDSGAGEGSGAGAPPQDINMLDMPAPVLSYESIGEAGVEFNTSEFRVRRDVTMLFSVTYQPGEFDWRSQELAEERSDVLFAFDYGSGIVRELFVAPNDDRLPIPLPVLVDERRLYTFTVTQVLPVVIGENANIIRLTELDLSTGVAVGEGEVTTRGEACRAMAGGDYYFRNMGELRVARDVTASGLAGGVETVGSADELCNSAELGSLDGRLVKLDAPAVTDPTRDNIELWAFDDEAGRLESTPLVSVRTSDVSLGTEGERAPIFAIADDGLYVLANDLVSLAIWFVPYQRRPGEPAGSSDPQTPTLVSQIELSFFADIVPFENSVISFDQVQGFAAVDGVLVAPIRLLEEAADGRFTWSALVVLDSESNQVDLLGFVFARLAGFGMVRSPQP